MYKNICEQFTIRQFYTEWGLVSLPSHQKGMEIRLTKTCIWKGIFFFVILVGGCFYFDCLQIRGLEKHIGLVAKWNFIASRTRNNILTAIFTPYPRAYRCSYLILAPKIYFGQSFDRHKFYQHSHVDTLISSNT